MLRGDSLRAGSDAKTVRRVYFYRRSNFAVHRTGGLAVLALWPMTASVRPKLFQSGVEGSGGR
jgi:hypothetical protein